MFSRGRCLLHAHQPWRMMCLGLVVLLCKLDMQATATEPPKCGKDPSASGQQVQIDLTISCIKNGNLVRTVAPRYVKTLQNLPAGEGIPNPYAGICATPDDAYDFLGLLQLLRSEGLAKTLAHPVLTTMSGRPGSFLAAGERAVPIPNGLGQVGVQVEELGTKINYLPTILSNGKVFLLVDAEVSSLNAANGTVLTGGVVVPGRTTNRDHMAAEMEPGQTMIIGGLIQKDEITDAKKVPILGDLPFVGQAFTQQVSRTEDEEIVILITPSIVDPQANDAATEQRSQETQSKLKCLEHRLKDLHDEVEDLQRELRSVCEPDGSNGDKR